MYFVKNSMKAHIARWNSSIVLFISLTLLLLVSVLYSGYNYMFDLDEINHLQRTFFVSIGKIPYIDYYSIYTPLFQWFELPFLWILGHSFVTLFVLRFVMLLFFILRLYLMARIGMILFGFRTAFVALVLLLWDPYTVFSAMQIRPDALMITLVMIGLSLLFQKNSQLPSRRATFLSGLYLSTGVLVHLKILPTVAVSVVFVLVYLFRLRQHLRIRIFCAGLIIPVVLFFGICLLQGNFDAMVQQSLIDPFSTFESLLYPAYVGEFMRPHNFNLFGYPGKPYNWMYLWIFPLVGFAGVYHAFMTAISNTSQRIKSHSLQWYLLIGLALSLVLQWLWLFRLNSVFIQYYLPISWLFAMFGGFAVVSFFNTLSVYPLVWKSMKFIGGVMLIFFTMFSIGANMERGKLTGYTDRLDYERLWSIVSEKDSVYPRLLFRDSPHPLSTAQFYPELSERVKVRYPTVPQSLENDQTDYLILSYYELDKMGPELRNYVKANYKKVENESGLYKRK